MIAYNSLSPRRWMARLAGRWSRAGVALAAGLALVAGCSDSGGTGTTPDYTLTLSPSSITIIPGEQDVTTVTINRTDFTGEVTLSLSGAPVGVTPSFDPVVTTGNTSTLTLTVGGATVSGNYNMSVRGTASVADRARQLALTVAPAPPSFSLAVDPSALTIAQGASNTTGVNITRTDFTGPVTLSLSGAPAGVTWDFSPPAPTGNGSVLTVNVGVATTPGVYDITVLGTGTVGNDSAVFTLTVTP